MDKLEFNRKKQIMWDELKTILVAVRPSKGKRACSDTWLGVKKGLLQPINIVSVPAGKDIDKVYLLTLQNRIDIAKKMVKYQM